jgi:hypothetical protein
LTLVSGVEPDRPPIAPYILSYDSSSSMTVKWQEPDYDGGFPSLYYRLYVDNTVEVELDPSINFYQLTGLTLGSTLKLQVSAVNEIGESILSKSNSVIFANIPSAPSSLTLTPTAYLASIKAEWTAPSTVNGDAVTGYSVYIDDGYGGEFELVLDGDSSSTYSY